LLHKYCPLLKGMQLTCTMWVESLITRDDSPGGAYRSSQKHESLSRIDLVPTGRHLLDVFIYNKPKVKFMCSSNQTEHHKK
jgi:hypothetical protein